MRKHLFLALCILCVLAVVIPTLSRKPRKGIPAGSSANSVAPLVAPAVPSTPPRTFSWKDLESEDYLKYVANLRSVGCPEPTVEDIVIADVNTLYLNKAKPLLDRLEGLVAAHYTARRITNAVADVVAASSVGFAQLDSERLGVIQRALSHPVEAAKTAVAPWEYLIKQIAENDLPYIAAEKRDRVRAIKKSVQERMRALTGQGRTVDAKFAGELDGLARQMEEELTKVLSGEELQAYLLRNSLVGQDFSQKFARLSLAESEYDSAFEAFKQFADKHGAWSGRVNPAEFSPSEAASRITDQVELDQKLRNILGDSKYLIYKRVNDPDFVASNAFIEGHSLSEEQASSLYALRNSVEREVLSANETPELSEGSGGPLVQAIVFTTEQKLAEILGPELTQQYLGGKSGSWLRTIKNRGSLQLRSASQTLVTPEASSP